MFSVRIVTTDHYMSKPLNGLDVQYSEFRGSEVHKVPVVRMYGATPAGQKTCMHVHGVFPYLYVPFDGTLPWDRYLRQFASSLDKAINVALGHGQSTIQHVYKVTLVSGIAMYGYHEKEEQFMKIYLYNPQMIRKAADLLLGGAVLNKPFQPHESHIPYTLQLFIDYNLYGMNMINVGAVKFRRGKEDAGHGFPGLERSVSEGSDEGLGSDPRTPYSISFTGLLNRSGSVTPSRNLWEPENIPSELYSEIEKESTCELEVDVVAADILNRLEVNANVGANPGLAALWEDERQRCRDRGVSPDDIAPPASPDRGDIENSDSNMMHLERLCEIIQEQIPYMDSQSDSESEMSQEGELDIPATPASEVHLHLSQDEENIAGSQETVIFDEEEEEEPVINVASIKHVVSASQSFSEHRLSQGVGSQDKPIIELLAALADDSSPPASQAAASQVALLEEGDSILAGTSQPRDEETEQQEEEEILEMSQTVWEGLEDEDKEEEEEKEGTVGKEEEEFDYAGLDDTWQPSQSSPPDTEDPQTDSEEDDSIPQFDGATDEKPAGGARKSGTKRLGIHGPATFAGGGLSPLGHGQEQRSPQMPHYNAAYGNSQGIPNQLPDAGMQQFGSYGYQQLAYNQYQNYSQWPGPRMHSPGLGQFSPPAESGAAWNQSQNWGMQQSPPLANSFGSQSPQHQPPGLQQQQQRRYPATGMPASNRPETREQSPFTQQHYSQMPYQSPQSRYDCAQQQQQQTAVYNQPRAGYQHQSGAIYPSQGHVISPTAGSQSNHMLTSSGKGRGQAQALGQPGDLAARGMGLPPVGSTTEHSAIARKKLGIGQDAQMALGAGDLGMASHKMNVTQSAPAPGQMFSPVQARTTGKKRLGTSGKGKKEAKNAAKSKAAQNAMKPSDPAQMFNRSQPQHSAISPGGRASQGQFPHFMQPGTAYHNQIYSQPCGPDAGYSPQHAMFHAGNRPQGMGYTGSQLDSSRQQVVPPLPPPAPPLAPTVAAPPSVDQAAYTKGSGYPPMTPEQPMQYSNPSQAHSKSVIAFAHSSNPFDDDHHKTNTDHQRSAVLKNDFSQVVGPLSPTDFPQTPPQGNFMHLNASPLRPSFMENSLPGQPRFQSSPSLRSPPPHVTSKSITPLEKLLLDSSDAPVVHKPDPIGSFSSSSTLSSPSSVLSEKQAPAFPSRRARAPSGSVSSSFLGSPLDGSSRVLGTTSPLSQSLEKAQLESQKQQRSYSTQKRYSQLNESQQDLFSDGVLSPRNQRSLSTPSLSVDGSSQSGDMNPLLDHTGCDDLMNVFGDSLESAPEPNSPAVLPQEPETLTAISIASTTEVASTLAPTSLSLTGLEKVSTVSESSSSLSNLESLVGRVNKDTTYGIHFVRGDEGTWKIFDGQKKDKEDNPPTSENSFVAQSEVPSQKSYSDYNFYNWPQYSDDDFQTDKSTANRSKLQPTSIKRALSVPGGDEKGRKGRMKKLGWSAGGRGKSLSHDGLASGSAYTYHFHVPTPVYKRFKLKFQQNEWLRNSEVKVVRMHPKDARKYSLMKVGREVVELHNMTLREIVQVQLDLKCGRSVSAALNGKTSCKNRTCRKQSESGSTGTPVQAVEIVSCDFEEDSSAEKKDSAVSNDVTLSSHAQFSVVEESVTSELPSQPSDTVNPHAICDNVIPDLNSGVPSESLVADNTNSKEKQSPSEKSSEPVLNSKEKAKRKSPTKNKSVVPRLKKYRAGFPFFGKAMAMKLKHCHPSLNAQVEDDTDVVLRDVSLTDASEGTLTPLKSRTPVSGRSPAHCAEAHLLDAGENKDYLDTKLKSLDELGMFNETTIEKAEFEETTDVEVSDEDEEDEDEEEDEEGEEQDNEEDNVDGKESSTGEGLQTVSSVECLSGVKVRDGVKEDVSASNELKASDTAERMNIDITETGDTESEDLEDPVPDNEHSEIHGKSADSPDGGDSALCDPMDVDVPNNVNDTDPGEVDVKILDTSSAESVDLDAELAGRVGEKDVTSIETSSSADGLSPVIENQSEISKDTALDVSMGESREPDAEKETLEKCDLFVKKQTESIITTKMDATEIDFSDILKPSFPENECRNDSVVFLGETENSDLRLGNNGLGSIVSGGSSEADLSPVIADVSHCDKSDGGEQGIVEREAPVVPKLSSPSAVHSEKMLNIYDTENSSQEVKDSSHQVLQNNGEKMNNSLLGTRPKSCSRSSSCESQSVSSRSGSRRGSVLENFKMDNSVFLESVARSSSTSADSFDTYKKKKIGGKKRKKKSGIGKPRKSRTRPRSRRTSDDDDDYSPSKSRNRSKRRRCDEPGSDSDGIEGVDFIIVGKFKGEKSMRVVLNRLTVNSESVSAKEYSERLEKLRSAAYSSRQKSATFSGIDLVDEGNHTLSCRAAGLSSEDEKLLTKCDGKTGSDKMSTSGEEQKPDIRDLPGDLVLHDKKQTTFDEPPVLTREEPGKEDMKKEEEEEEVVPMEDTTGESSSLGKIRNVQNDSFLPKSTGDSVKAGTVPSHIGSALEKVDSSSSDEILGKQLDSNSVARIYHKGGRKKKGSTIHDRMSRAFLSRKKSRKKKSSSGSKKLMCTLSVLHDATMEKLTEPQHYNRYNNEMSKSQRSDSSTRGTSLAELFPRKLLKLDMQSCEKPKQELYGDTVDDLDYKYSDTMYKLALFSPPASEKGDSSPPQPLSPEEVQIPNGCVDALGLKMKSLYDTPLSSVEACTGKPKSRTLKSNAEAGGSDSDVEVQGPKTKKARPSLSLSHRNSNKTAGKPVKTAVVKLAPLTLKDIQSYCSEESDAELSKSLSSKKTEESVSPPDLGPPIIPRFSPRHMASNYGNCTTPPHLTRGVSESSSCSDADAVGSRVPYRSRSPRVQDTSDESKTAPPYLTPYTNRSPRMPLSPRGAVSPRTPISPRGAVSPRLLGAEAGYQYMGDGEMRSYFNIPVSETSRSKPGHSPANSSASSINIVHSEEFSDISDDDEPPSTSQPITSQLSGLHGSSSAPDMYNSFMNPAPDLSQSLPTSILNKDQKLKDLREFEKRLRISSEKKNMFAQMLSKNSIHSSLRERHSIDFNAAGHPDLNMKDQALDLSFSAGCKQTMEMRVENKSTIESDVSKTNLLMQDKSEPSSLTASDSKACKHQSVLSSGHSVMTTKDFSGDLFDSELGMKNISNTSDFASSADGLGKGASLRKDSLMTSYSQSSVLGSSQASSLDVSHLVSGSGADWEPALEFARGGRKPKKQTLSRSQGRSQKSGSAGDAGAGRNAHSDSGDGSLPGNNNGRQGSGPGQAQQLLYSSGCQVITPQILPPSKESIQLSANEIGLPSVQAQGAYYGNPRDVPEKPRELGRQVLKVPTTLVKNLPEFNSSVNVEGLVGWRTVFCVQEGIDASQGDGEAIIDRLQTEPNLKYALTGDQPRVIAPCAVPPSRKNVEEWLKGRQLYKALMREKKRERKNGVKKRVENEEDKEEKCEDISKPEVEDNLRLNLFTGKRECVTEQTELNESETKQTEQDVDMEDEFGLKSSGEDESATQANVSTTDLLHSTPVVRRSSSDLFEPSCTPIAGEKGADKEQEPGTSFVTPKRIRPLRRLSTNTETTLRRSILTSQMKNQFSTPADRRDVSQIEGPTPKNSFGFKVSQRNLQEAKALHEFQYLTAVSLELHVETRGDLRPDPEVDAMQAIFYSVFNDVPAEKGTRHETGVILIEKTSANQETDTPGSVNHSTSRKRALSPSTPGQSTSRDPGSKVKGSRFKDTLLQKSGIVGLKVTYVADENELLKTFIEFIVKWDPDILVGFEIQMLSWGYLLKRAAQLSVNLCAAISRVPGSKQSSHHSAEKDEWGADHASEIHVAGRVVLNLWRLLRHEVTLNVYTFENVVYHVLHQRIPLYSHRSLTAWYRHRTHLHRWKVVQHYVTRVKANLEMMDKLDFIGKTSEFARVFGIEFYHVLSRGSQYRVESMMLRVAKPLNYIPLSPSVHQRARMKAPECIALTLEPESRFYTDPVVVLDFQSLYPSIMIAYNYCFSTCLGRLDWLAKAHEGPIDFGCTSLPVKPSVLKKLRDKVTVSPNGVVFLKQSVRKGVISTMVEEILNTRLMVKKGLKGYKGDKTLSRMLDARQLGLKLIANVTYGYTAANFSGRMPCVEVADSIVRKARESLERSIQLVEQTPRWGAKVIYGDTDSMFLLMKGRSKDEAFKIGQEIADAVTAMFPKPMKLKFEKVYLPCVLQTKKRYVGFMYETPDQKEPVYDAKGIETVRRDSCSAVSKILERSIKILFSSRNVSDVKSYVQQQCQKVMEGTVSLQDCIFAKEYRGMTGYRPGACVPALEISKKLIRHDRKSEPRVGERVPYVIVYGSPGLPLIQLVRQPLEVLQDPSLRLNATYYITKQILPPLNRFLSLLGVDVFSWYQEMPHVGYKGLMQTSGPQDARKGTISQYFATSNCPLCDRQTKRPICERCMKDPQTVCVTLNERVGRWERVQERLSQICQTCTGSRELETVKACVSLDCPVLYRSFRARGDIGKADRYREILAKLFTY